MKKKELTFHEFVFDSLQTMRLSPGVAGALAGVNCFLAVNFILMCEVTCRSFSKKRFTTHCWRSRTD